ncbi:DNA replication/repair protein RecF [Enterococcus nangangensis]|uniref:DNA replication/repair protein RecF n=1 Tax=Enterococcus nangangensis TaxID=2559926 RepID=UPI0010F483C2|nr:DNA replication/repair protein RecF [Enterococcus nangangensis]
MRLEELTLKDYRNYDDLHLAFPKSLNIFLGENAQGKTNILEAIYVLAMSKSHRTHNEKELIAWQKEYSQVKGVVKKATGLLPLEVQLSKKGRKTKVNYLEQKKLSDYIGHLNVILFAPEDLSLVKGGPAVRRRFIDMELGQISPKYLYELVRYNQLLKQRNAYLKQLAEKKATDELYLDVLTEQFVASGVEILLARYGFLQKLEGWSQKLHHEITHEKETLTFHYQGSLPTTATMTKEELATLFTAQLTKKRPQEIFRGTTLVGPHRDDLLFLINDKDVQTYGSQGQQRTTALSVKLAEIDLIHEEIGEYPILLLDDVMSELDDQRQLHLLETIEGKVQTFLTTTTLTHLQEHLTVTPAIFQVAHGTIERQGETL